MFVPSGWSPIATTVGAELGERLRGDARVRAVRTVDGDRELREIAAESLDDVARVARADHLEVVDAPFLLALRRIVEVALDLLLDRVGQLLALSVEELDAVVLRRVVRRGDDGAEVEREERDGGRRQDPGEDGVTSCRRDTRGERSLELAARRARVAADQHRAGVCPDRRRAPDPLDELGSERLPDDAPHAVGTEVSAPHQARSYLLAH